MLTGFGTFWAGEGVGIDWPAGDAAILVLFLSGQEFGRQLTGGKKVRFTRPNSGRLASVEELTADASNQSPRNANDLDLRFGVAK